MLGLILVTFPVELAPFCHCQNQNLYLISPLFSDDKISLLGFRKLGLQNVLMALNPLW